MSTDMLSDRALLAWGTFFRSNFMTLDSSSPATSHSTVMLLLFGALTSVPYFNSRSTILTCPMMLASMRAVILSLSLVLMSTSSFDSSFTTLRWSVLVAGV